MIGCKIWFLCVYKFNLLIKDVFVIKDFVDTVQPIPLAV
uniref:Uncharacterized protein n=1 Tax=Salmonella sp. 96A-29192 TaxID=1179814 RepID=I3VZH9_9ENTR|nr:hypothetical protein [Salmonella sp. 96A-29192]